jgi:hypothetical protein
MIIKRLWKKLESLSGFIDAFIIGSETVETKDIITLIGIFATLLIGVWNLLMSGKNRFITHINTERVMWVNKVRDIFSEFNKSSYIQSQLRKKYGSQIPVDDDLSNELIYLVNHIELYLNPRETVVKKLIELQEKITVNLINYNRDFLMNSYEQSGLSLHYLQQIILKVEWKRIKNETKKGRELNDSEMKSIFINTAKEIDDGKGYYDEILKGLYG